MSDDKKTEKPPLNDPDVNVQVTPKDITDHEHIDAAEKLADKLGKNLQKAVEENKSGGKEKQFAAAESEVKKAKESADPKKIESIDVLVGGTNEDGDGEGRAWSVAPKENKPLPE